MTTAELLTEYGSFYEGIRATSSDYLPFRRRAKRDAQRVVDRTWNLRNWPWKIAEATLSATEADPDPDLPADFLRFPRAGGAFLAPNQPPLAWRPLAELQRLRKRLDRTGTPERYSVGGQTTDGVKTLVLEPRVLTTTPVYIVYEPRGPRLVDSLDPGDVAEFQGTDGLARIPEQYHRTVIFEGMRYFQMENKANAQSVLEQLALWRQGEKDMVSQEMQGIEAPHRIPRFRAGRR